jgi:hypothetical protein
MDEREIKEAWRNRAFAIAQTLNLSLEYLDPENRLDVIRKVSDGYCQHCGFLKSQSHLDCTCKYDEEKECPL